MSPTSPFATLLFDTQCALGEGIVWDARAQMLLFVDIDNGVLYRANRDFSSLDRQQLSEKIGWVLPAQAGGYYAGMRSGVGHLSALDSPAIRWIARFLEDRPSLRLNDAVAGPSGHLWAGTLNDVDERRDDGALYRISRGGAVDLVDAGYKVCNGPVISPDGRRLFHTDSARRVIYQFDHEAGEIRNRRVWKQFSEAEGYPDGMTFDAQGRLWVAHWGASCISCFDLDGSLLSRVPIPVAHVTNVCFAGPRLDRLLVTTARKGRTEDELAAEPRAGGVFEVHGHGATGVEAAVAALG